MCYGKLQVQQQEKKDMQIDIATQNTELTPALEQAINEKLQTLNFYKKIQKTNSSKPEKTQTNPNLQDKVYSKVTLTVDGHRHQVDISITGVSAKTLNASSITDDMYKSIHQAGNTLERLWRKQKAAALSNRRDGSIKRLNAM